MAEVGSGSKDWTFLEVKSQEDVNSSEFTVIYILYFEYYFLSTGAETEAVCMLDGPPEISGNVWKL